MRMQTRWGRISGLLSLGLVALAADVSAATKVFECQFTARDPQNGRSYASRIAIYQTAEPESDESDYVATGSFLNHTFTNVGTAMRPMTQAEVLESVEMLGLAKSLSLKSEDFAGGARAYIVGLSGDEGDVVLPVEFLSARGVAVGSGIFYGGSSDTPSVCQKN